MGIDESRSVVSFTPFDEQRRAEQNEVRRAIGMKLLPELGQRYRWTDMVGASFEATLASWGTIRDADGARLRIEFEDHRAFETNCPIDYELIEA